MINAVKKLKDFVFSHTMKKSNILGEVANIKSSLENEVIPSFEKSVEYFKTTTVTSDINVLFNNVADHLQINASKGPVGVMSELNKFAAELVKGCIELEKIVDSDLPDYITDKDMTAKSAGILGTVSNFTTMTMFLIDLNLYLLYRTKNEDMYYVKKTNSIKNLIPIFGDMYKKYRNNISNVMKETKNLSDTEIGDVSTFTMSASKRDKQFNLPINNFIGNPIYYFRMWMVELDLKQYEYLKDKKKLIELKLLDMKMQDNGEPSPKIQKQIEYYEDKLAGIEYKLNKLKEK